MALARDAVVSRLASRLAPLWAALFALACVRPTTPPSATPSPPVATPAAGEQASGAQTRWRYQIRLDTELRDMALELCIDGPLPRRLVAEDGALEFVRTARVADGPQLTRDGDELRVPEFDAGCLELTIDLRAAANAGGRDAMQRGDALMVPPERWLWHPKRVPAGLDAQLRFDLAPGVYATGPWPAAEGEAGWRRLDRSSFGWSAWVVFSPVAPLEFDAGGTHVEVAVLPGERRASDAGIVEWLRVATETSAALLGHFPREQVSVAVIPVPGLARDPVLFGMARRGGGASAMLMLDSEARDDELPGEWVAIHELLHLCMPYVREAWLAEGLVTYYTQIVRARRRVFPGVPADARAQQLAALDKLATNFARNRGGARSLATASARMRQLGGYRRVYWGGAAAAFELDLRVRQASAGRRSLDDLLAARSSSLGEYRRWSADELLASFDEELARWLAAGELESALSTSALAAEHLDAKLIPARVRELRGLAVEVDGGRVRLLAHPKHEVDLREALLAALPLAPADESTARRSLPEARFPAIFRPRSTALGGARERRAFALFEPVVQ